MTKYCIIVEYEQRSGASKFVVYRVDGDENEAWRSCHALMRRRNVRMCHVGTLVGKVPRTQVTSMGKPPIIVRPPSPIGHE